MSIDTEMFSSSNKTSPIIDKPKRGLCRVVTNSEITSAGNGVLTSTNPFSNDQSSSSPEVQNENCDPKNFKTSTNVLAKKNKNVCDFDSLNKDFPPRAWNSSWNQHINTIAARRDKIYYNLSASFPPKLISYVMDLLPYETEPKTIVAEIIKVQKRMNKVDYRRIFLS